jgi:general secretion pathway protein J
MTLIEVMIAIGIVITMAAIGWASVGDAVELNDALANGDMTTRSARVALSRLRRELQLAYLTPHRQSRNQYWTVFISEDTDPDSLYFATLAHQRLYKNSRECDQAEITVWGERAPRDQGIGEILYHRESKRIDEEPAEGGRVWPLAYNVHSFNLRFLDGRINEWMDEWNSENAEFGYRLPRAVQMGLVLLQADVEDERDTTEVPFLTTVLLEYADPIQPLLGSGLDPVTGQPAAGNAGAAGGAANPFGLPAAGWGGAGAGGGF